MNPRFNIVAVAISALATHASAQTTTGATNPVGVWRGTSKCLVLPSPCHDEVVVYRTSRGKSSDSVALDARKIVNGQEVDMGVLGCTVDTQGTSFTCALARGVWRFTIRGDSLVGELRQSDNTKFRDVRAVRSH